ncbi:antibiotic biosynthesis monooxygenase [Aliiglaciecola sp. CAU 1673]|uniref:antibiotic biosynthesis monooxygenase family protein n=1 Tax=Aliiglaciecola sp. CAU 1673 TaxID=3032595 RepID=UPI0023DBFA3D|nr:antibiotic biosynthesis monooxygenase [Aliiglaciecola sp. CAU 1673]MDF2176737.1 antibiotic biosynthesis monooxygenase [Aliiglaciecola sp. CAU 1673]
MYAVIFRAEVGDQDQEYSDTAAKMRELAISQYGCLEFIAVTEGDQEIAISYWPDEASILAWKQDVQHRQAQQQGQARWYKSYQVQVVKVKREYSFPNAGACHA